MAFDRKDANAVITNGMFSGNWGSVVAINADEKYTRILSHGLLDAAPTPVVVEGDSSGGLNDVGTATQL